MFPLDLLDISFLLAVNAIILLITSELLSPYHGKTNLLINKKKLANTAITFSIFFLITVAVKITEIIFSQ